MELASVLLEATQQSDVNRAGVDGVAPLGAAAAAGSIELVRLLIAKGSDVNHRAANGVTALYTCCSHGLLDVAKVIHAAGADVSLTMNSDGASPLFVACAKGYTDIAEWLLSVGADPNQVRASICAKREKLSRASTCDISCFLSFSHPARISNISDTHDSTDDNTCIAAVHCESFRTN